MHPAFLVLLLAPCVLSVAYVDSFGRSKMLPLASAAYSTAPQKCLTNVYTNAVLKRQITVKCDPIRTDKCSGFTATLAGDKAIVIAFRGTDAFLQLVTESDQTVFGPQIAWVAGGKVSKYFNDAFMSVWNGGMKDDFLALKNANPTFQVWVTGHSLGGAMASLAASYIVANKIVPASSVILYTMGQPRTGDHGWSSAHDGQGFNGSFRVTHWRDVVPHLPLEDMEGYYHHKTEVFYHNSMSTSASFKVCAADEDKGCSDGLDITTSIEDHLHYYDKDISGWGDKGCK